MGKNTHTNSSVYEIEMSPRLKEYMDSMKIIMCKGIGYMVVPKKCSPEMALQMGLRIAEEMEEGNL